MKSYDVTFEDWDGKKVTEKYYFHINETEWNLLNARYGGNLMHTMARLTKERSPEEALKIILDVVKTAYGVMDDDRIHFRKASTNPKIWEDFVSSPGFDKFFIDVMSDDAKTAEFINGIMPKKLRDAARADMENSGEASKKVIELSKADVTIT